MEEMLTEEKLVVVPDARPLWPQIFEMAKAANVETEVLGGGALLSDGTGVWWAAAQQQQGDGDGGGDGAAAADGGGGIDALLAGLRAMPPAHIADEALAEWLKFFAGHKGQDR